MSKQKTAVDWLIDEIEKLRIQVSGDTQVSAIRVFEQAKELEKQQTIDAYKADNTSYYPKDEREKAAKQYYSDTYK